MQLPIVKIIAKNETGYIIINKSDFDASRDKLFTGLPPRRKRKPPKPKSKPSNARVSLEPKQSLDDALSYDQPAENPFADV